MISSNLAVQYAQVGLRVILIDLDFGAANVHTIFGLRKQIPGLGNFFFSSPSHPLVHYLHPTSEEKLSIISGGSFVPEMANLKERHKLRLINAIASLPADCVILDLGAGTSSHTIDFFSMTDVGLLITTPEPTSVVNVYEFLKNVVYRMIYRLLKKDRAMLSSFLKENQHPCQTHSSFTIVELLSRLRNQDPWLAEIVDQACGNFRPFLLLNQVKRPEEITIGKQIHQLAGKFLHLSLHYAGILFSNEQIASSVVQMNPFSLTYPDILPSRMLRVIAKNILLDTHHFLRHFSSKLSFEEEYQAVCTQMQENFEANFCMEKQTKRKREQLYSLLQKR